ncbi:hypothetical protein [Methanosarcina horonobensis]|uniref:hypothetical protein n=1 Tax=Methanosarcina horonobensis TaxID=418008 RepID=UPI0022B8D9DB|nr:hypothetical protein [Methanosarcina horonobensis]
MQSARFPYPRAGFFKLFSPCHVDQGLVGILWDLKATEKGELYNFPVSKPYLVEIVREFKILDFFYSVSIDPGHNKDRRD